jgi:ABC-2 type transport system ATP-binding protein
MIRVSNLTKRYGHHTALDNISFDVKSGEIVGFLGPNGAGKTTTMRILAGFLPATGGDVVIAGLDVFRQSMDVRRRIGYLPEHFPVYPEMRVREYLKFRGRLKGLWGKRLRERIRYAEHACGLEMADRRVIGRLSLGYRQRVGLADALVGDPDLLILDEPTVGLDPNQIRQVRALIKGLAKQHTVLLSSHILAEVEMVCDRVLIINAGRIVASDTPENLVAVLHGNPCVIADIRGDADTVAERLAGIGGVRKVRRQALGDQWSRFICETEKGYDVRTEVSGLVAAHGWALRELYADRERPDA